MRLIANQRSQKKNISKFEDTTIETISNVLREKRIRKMNYGKTSRGQIYMKLESSKERGEAGKYSLEQ